MSQLWGTVDKEQLAVIRRVEQTRFSEVVRTIAAVKRAEATIIANAKYISMVEGSGFGLQRSIWV